MEDGAAANRPHTPGARLVEQCSSECSSSPFHPSRAPPNARLAVCGSARKRSAVGGRRRRAERRLLDWRGCAGLADSLAMSGTAQLGEGDGESGSGLPPSALLLVVLTAQPCSPRPARCGLSHGRGHSSRCLCPGALSRPRTAPSPPPAAHPTTSHTAPMRPTPRPCTPAGKRRVCTLHTFLVTPLPDVGPLSLRNILLGEGRVPQL